MTKGQFLGQLWLFKEAFNSDDIPLPADFEAYGKALMICANGDGTLKSEEKDWIIGYMAAFSAPQKVLERLMAFNGEGDLKETFTIQKLANESRHYLLYDAIRACAADGEYHEDEKRVIHKMGYQLGLSQPDIEKIESLFFEEQKLRQRKFQILFPEQP